MPRVSKSKIKTKDARASKSKTNKKNQTKKSKKPPKLQLQNPKGMYDILPQDQFLWNKIRKTGNEIADFYNFSRIDTPILENFDLFERGVGPTTDIVEKEMFFLKTRGGDKLALRPEGTAGVVRAYIQHGLSRITQPVKLYYFGPMFRYERPQHGRYRQFFNIGFEILGGKRDCIYDAQIILATYRTIEELKIKNLVVRMNSVGCKNCRLNYKNKLRDYYRLQKNKICNNCRQRLKINPLRLLDCKSEACKAVKNEAPIMIDYFCPACQSHLKRTLEYLDELNIPYVLDNYLVRGLDYYNRTVFEIYTDSFDFALAGGGRYDYLGKILKARQTELPAVGASIGVERLLEAMGDQKLLAINQQKPKVFLIQIGELAKKRALCLIEDFRKAGIRVNESLGKDSLKTQLKIADKEQAVLALIFGQKEVFEDNIIIRNMKTGVQETVSLEKMVDQVKKRLKQ